MLKFDDLTGIPLPKTEAELRSSLYFVGWFAEEVEARVRVELDGTCMAELIGPSRDYQLDCSTTNAGVIRMIGWECAVLEAALAAVGIPVADQ